MGPDELAILERLDKRQEQFEAVLVQMGHESREMAAEIREMAVDFRGRFEALKVRMDIIKEAVDAVAEDVAALRQDVAIRDAHFAQKIGILESDVAVLKARK